MRFHDLTYGQLFKWLPDGGIWEYRGNGWWGRPYSGGPWHTADNPEVILIQ